MATPKVYAVCDANCKWETLTREQILTAISQAVNEGTISDIDTGFVRTIRTINGVGLRFFVGTQAEYNALTEDEKTNLFAIISDDATKEGIEQAISQLQEKATSLENANKATNERIDSTNSNLASFKTTTNNNFTNANNKATALDERLTTAEETLTTHGTKLAKVGAAPTLNSDKLLPTYGYYYIYAYNTVTLFWYFFGVVWYSPMQDFDITINALNSDTVKLVVTADGELTVPISDGTNTAYQYNFYTGLVAGI